MLLIYSNIKKQSSITTAHAVSLLACMISLLHIWMNTVGNVSSLLQNGIHFTSFVVLSASLIFSAHKDGLSKLMRIIILAFGILVGFSALYLIFAEAAIYERGVKLSVTEWILGAIVLCGALEFTRRATGIIIPILIVFSLTYVTLWGQYVPGVFNFRSLSAETVMFRSIFGDDAIFGTIARISSSYVFMFIIFGAFLLRSGGADFIVNISRSLADRLVGGPGIVAVLASALTGTISGSAVANTASTGVITIPLMKRAGFSPKFAAAVEASASTGGQLMPPIMGAGAFIMASVTQIPYSTIVSVSIFPAALFFATVIFFVRIEAKKHNIKSVATPEKNTSIKQILQDGGPSFVLPISVLMWMLIQGYTPTYAAGIAIIVCIFASWLTPNKKGIREIFSALEIAAKNMVMTAILLCSIGLIVNVISTTGIGNIFSIMISDWSNGHLWLAVILVGAASLILGMGLPVTAAYIVLGTLSAPALYQLILRSKLVTEMIAGTLPDSTRQIIGVLFPERAAEISNPMSSAMAKSLLDSLPLETLLLIFQTTFSAPVLASALLAAHLIIFWLSQDSNVTPPVCMTAFTAAAIAKSPPMATGLIAWKISKGLYFVPVLIAYTSLTSGNFAQMFEVFFFSFFGLWALCAAIEGHWEKPLSQLERVVLMLVAFALMWPLDMVIHMTILFVWAFLFLYNLKKIEVCR